MEEHHYKLQTVKWYEGTNIDSIAAYSEVISEKHALELARIINKEGHMIAFALAAGDGKYRIEIPNDDTLKRFKEEFPSVKVEKPRQALQRIRDDYKNKSPETSVNAR